MKSLRTALIAAAALAALVPRPAQSLDRCDVVGQANCDGGGNITFAWTVFPAYGDPPIDRPDWIGWDMVRYSVADCGETVRVNDEPIPRAGYQYSYTESAPATQKLFYYRVYPVDANRQEITNLCAYSNTAYDWTSCPEFSVPITIGTIRDDGLLWVDSCPNSCYSTFYTGADELRQYAGTGEVLRLYGSAHCGTVEGCALHVDHYELAACVVTPTLRTSWGSVKAIYR